MEPLLDSLSPGCRPKLHGIATAATCPLPHCAGSPVDMTSPTYLSECEQCVTECDLPDCDLTTENDQCTDRCVVVPCEDPCLDVCGTSYAPGYNSPCEGELCAGFQDLLDCCPGPSYPETIYAKHDVPNHVRMQQDTQHLDWSNVSLSRELDALICACTTQPLPHSFDSNYCDPKLLSISKPQSHSLHHYSSSALAYPPMPSPGSPSSVLFSPLPSSSASARSSPGPSTSLTSHAYPSQHDVTAISPHSNASFHPLQSSQTMFCLWAGCGQPFNSFQDLISHVNLTHLRLSVPQEGFTSPQHFSTHQLPTTSFSAQMGIQGHPTPAGSNPLACMWDNCNVYPAPSHIPGPSTGDIFDAASGFLATHLLQDHLGIPVTHSSTFNNAGSRGLGPVSSDPSPPSPSSVSNLSPIAFYSESSLPPPQPVQEVLPPSQHRCKWQPCTDGHTVFASSADLTAHITDVHVGGGKPRYHCMWGGCTRHGEAGFSSKQKILRHIQSHTGHRPFRCTVCEQYFSEAATLQQHKRRHTKEKPYLCDYPGCNKAFAITGALTIHRRCHSGVKPFKCTYCNRSFSESSNLSKHIRTHTGDRPYACTHPGCEKRFARPDQVARHMNVHTKKKVQAEADGDAGAMGGGAGEDGMDVQYMKVEG